MRHSSIALTAALAALLAASTFAKDTYDLRVIKDAGDLAKVRAQLEVTGTLRTKADGQEKQHSLSVSALMEYGEHRLSASGDGRSSLRYYDKAEAKIRIDQGEHQPKLAAGRRLAAVYVTAEKARLFCPGGHLTRDELDLIDIPGNSAVLPLLLPRKEVQVSDKWPAPADALAMLLGIDAVSSTDVQCTLTEVTAPQIGSGRLAKVQFAGHVDGSAGGVATEIALKGNFDYDMKARRVARLDMQIEEDRAIGHVGPGLKVNCRVQLVAHPLKNSPQLMDDRTIRLARSPDPEALLLAYESADGYRLLHSRQWHVVDQRENVTALRLIEGGELLAQCNIAPAKKDGSKPDQAGPQTLMAYQQEVKKALDKRFRKQLLAKETKTKTGLEAFIVVAEGEAQDVPVRWVYYLLTHASGKQVGLAFTLEPKHVERFGAAAEELVNTLRIDGPAPAKATTAKAPVTKAPATKPRSQAVNRVPVRKPRVAR
jgi:hypothetical protein